MRNEVDVRRRRFMGRSAAERSNKGQRLGVIYLID